MDERHIIELYWNRCETAIAETARKYGGYCFKIAYNILANHEDSEECVNDTYWKAWKSIPPTCPRSLAAFLGRITRNLALNRFETCTAQKRGGSQVDLALEELHECLTDGKSTEERVEDRELANALNEFLTNLPSEARKLFLQRYWELMPIKEIAKASGISESKVKMSLKRTRDKLRAFLEKEEIAI